jgi:hypothetical protein
MTLTRIVSWSHALLQEVLRLGDQAVDLTAGKGRDLLMLADAVGAEGQVVAFDIQAEAIDQAAEALRSSGRTPVFWRENLHIPRLPGCFLVQACHSSLEQYVGPGLQAIVANLGYFPGGDPNQVTKASTTIAALQTGLKLLGKGGRLAVTVYPGHAGGPEEGGAVLALFRGLPSDTWQVLHVAVANHRVAPYLLVAEKKR